MYGPAIILAPGPYGQMSPLNIVVMCGANAVRVQRSSAMTIEIADVLVIDRVGDLPTFCAFAYQGENRSVVTWIDFWAVEPCGSGEADYLRGQHYADEAIGHVRATGQRVFIECVLMFIAIKLRETDRCAGGLEHGFVDRIAGHFPGAIDNVLTRSLRRCAKALN
jgi:hypothetical protein